MRLHPASSTSAGRVARFCRSVFGAAALVGVVACGGAAPLMHPAHAIAEDEFTLGAGFSGTVPVSPPAIDGPAEAVVESGAFAPGIAPWIGGRYGLGNDFDAG